MRARKIKRGRKAVWYGMCGVLALFATLSYTNLEDSLHLHMATKDRLEHAKMEQKYITSRLEDVRKNSRRKRYDAEDIGFTEPEKTGRIDLRGASLSFDEDQVFSEKEVEFNVIEQ